VIAAAVCLVFTLNVLYSSVIALYPGLLTLVSVVAVLITEPLQILHCGYGTFEFLLVSTNRRLGTCVSIEPNNLSNHLAVGSNVISYFTYPVYPLNVAQ